MKSVCFYLQSYIFLSILSLLSTLHALDSPERYCIKEGYVSRTSYTHFDDTGNKDECQDEVYCAAQVIAKTRHYRNIGDIGCGSGFKLIKYFKSHETVGFEIEPTLSFLKAKYPDRRWEVSDFSHSLAERQFDLIVCADVIEHLVNPNELLEWIKECNFELLIISTPDRARLLKLYGNNIQSQVGPPLNPCHVREWTFDEFASYIGQHFDIVSHFHCKKEYWGQVIVVKKRNAH